MAFTDELRHKAQSIWDGQLAHPFVRGIGDGTLPAEKFGIWLRQDYLFLIDYGRALGYVAARAPDLETTRVFASVMHETLHDEMDLHRSYVAAFDITIEELEHEEMLPTTRGYADFLLRTAATADFAEAVAAILPCMWGYSEIGRALAERGLPDDERYARWITLYADDEFATLATWCRAVLDAVVDGLSSDRRQHVEAAFIMSSRYELAFWDMAWRDERWMAIDGVEDRAAIASTLVPGA